MGQAPRQERGQSQEETSPQAVPDLSSEPGHPVWGLVVPELMAQKLNSPNVRVRLRALEAWARSTPPGAVDPFILAFEDPDERARARVTTGRKMEGGLIGLLC